MLADRVADIQRALVEERLDGWFFSCFQGNDPISLELLGFPEGQLVSRRCYYFVPRTGEPRKLVHALEPAMLDHLPGEKDSYLRWAEHREKLIALVKGNNLIAAQYSPENALPAISRLDAGTAELLRQGAGVELVGSGDLVQRFAAVWTDDQLAGHRRACEHLHRIALEAFDRVAVELKAGRDADEYTIQKFILESFENAGMWTESDPIVAINAHAADPHYQPGPNKTAPITKDDFLLIDLWAKEKAQGSVYADITWCGVCAAEPEDRHAEIFRIVADARDAGLALVESRYPDSVIRGYEVDDATRAVIDNAGYGDQYIHRTGHSIGVMDHGHGANMDNLETHDTRQLLPMTGFSIEPGIYLPGDFGVRSEINVVLTPDGVEVTGGERQQELLRLLA